MTTKTISTYVAAGYALSTNYSALTITATGGIGGTGLTAAAFATITNLGRVNESSNATGAGVFLDAGGTVTNGSNLYPDARIEGLDGIQILNGAGTVFNLGTILAQAGAVDILGSGMIVNGDAQTHGAFMEGDVTLVSGAITNRGTIDGYVSVGTGTISNLGTAATIDASSGVVVDEGNGFVRNTGTIVGLSSLGVGVFQGGNVVNGSSSYTNSLISAGADGVYLNFAGTVANYGTIGCISYQGFGYGVRLRAGGLITNGSGQDTKALIDGPFGVLAKAAATIVNYGSISGSSDQGVDLQAGGRVTNGAGTDRAALIEGATGIAIAGGAGTVINFGAIEGLSPSASQAGVYLTDGGVVTNGGGVNRTATIQGESGVLIAGGAGTIKNLGTVLGAGGSNSYGVSIYSGYITNGSVNNAKALIEGYGGVELLSHGQVVNLGTIAGLGDSSGSGAYLSGANVSLVNGGAGHAGAVIEGYVGLRAQSYATVTNYGTIEGASGVALQFAYNVPSLERNIPNPNHDLLNVEAGSAFIGAVKGGGGTINLASGSGTISNFAGADLTVSGSMAVTSFAGFYTVEIASGAQFTDTGAVTILAGQTLNDSGVLTLGGAGVASIVNAGLIETTGAGAMTLAGAVNSTGTLAVGGGTLIVGGAVTGKGVVDINAGTLDLASSFNQAVTFTGTTGVLELAQSQTYTASVTGFSRTGSTSLDLVDIGFVSATEATFSGNKAGGVLTVTDGTHTAKISLKGNYLGATWVASSDGHGGTIVIDPRMAGILAPPETASSPGSIMAPHQLIAAMAGLGAGPGAAMSTQALTRPRDMAEALLTPRTSIA